MIRTIIAAVLAAALSTAALAQQPINTLPGTPQAVQGTDLIPMYQGANPAAGVAASAVKTYVNSGVGTMGQVTVGTSGGAGSTGTCSSTTSINCVIATQEIDGSVFTSSGSLASTDTGKLDAVNAAGATTITLTNFVNGNYVNLLNENTGTATLSAGSGSIKGCTSLAQNQSAHIQYDGTNWNVQCGAGSTSPGGSSGQVQTNNGSGGFNGITNAALTALINAATASLSGALPAWPNNTTTFFRGDGTYDTLNCAALTNSAASCSTDTTNASNISSGTLATARMAAAPFATGSSTGNTVAGPYAYFVCTAACTVTPPVPVAGYQFCVMNDDNVSSIITLGALGSSALYEKTARTGYGTAGTGTLSSAGAVGDMICIVGRDSTHYLSPTYVGTWTAS